MNNPVQSTPRSYQLPSADIARLPRHTRDEWILPGTSPIDSIFKIATLSIRCCIIAQGLELELFKETEWSKICLKPRRNLG